MDTDDNVASGVPEGQISPQWSESTEQQLAGTNFSAENLSVDILEENFRIKEQFRQLEKSHRSVIDKLVEERDTAQKELDYIKNDNSLVVCLIDGDGAIFDQEHLKQREKGGRDAAQILVTKLKAYIKTRFKSIPPGTRVMVTLFCFKNGLSSALQLANICTSEDLNAFFKGFVQAHPLINVVDVGYGKEAADNKMREHLDLFLQIPQTKIVFFGGCHDSGYKGPLLAAQTDGWKEKIVLLQSYSDMPRDIETLGFDSLNIPGLFLPEKIQSFVTPSNPLLTLPAGQHMDPKTPPKRTVQNADLSPRMEPMKHRRLNSDGQKIQTSPKFKRKLCLFHYLGSGCTEELCQYDHESHLSAEEREIMEQDALKQPCRTANENKPCQIPRCFWGHFCPQGSSCEFYARGKCRFRGDDMHRNHKSLIERFSGK